MSEPKTIAPITLFGNRPGFGGTVMRDFRPRPVKAEDVHPVALPVPPVEELDPKANSSATASATSSGIDSDEKTPPAQTTPPLQDGASFVSAETGSLPPTLTIQPGSSRPPVGTTGQTSPPAPPSSETPSSPDEDKP